MNSDQLTLKIEELRSQSGLKSVLPSMPVSVVLMEASELFKWTLMDKDTLLKKGLNWKVVEDIPLRIEVLRRLETEWKMEKLKPNENHLKWKIGLQEAIKLREEILHHLYYSLRSLPGEYAKLKIVAKGKTNAAIIQSLLELSEIGKKNMAALEKNGVDISILENARTKSFELPKLLAKSISAKKEKSENLVLRNKAFYHLKEAVEEVRVTGRYAFWKNKERYKGYVSAYIKRKEQKYK